MVSSHVDVAREPARGGRTGSSHLQGLLKDVLLENSPGSRVVYESSCLEQWGHIDWNDIGWGGPYFLLQCVACSEC